MGSWRLMVGGWRLLVLLAFVIACAAEQKPIDEPGQKLYPLNGVILSRGAMDNSLRIQHETIPGYMVGMTMEFPVRGVAVSDLPANGSKITATLHVTAKSFWITDVKKR